MAHEDMTREEKNRLLAGLLDDAADAFKNQIGSESFWNYLEESVNIEGFHLERRTVLIPGRPTDFSFVETRWGDSFFIIWIPPVSGAYVGAAT